MVQPPAKPVVTTDVVNDHGFSAFYTSFSPDGCFEYNVIVQTDIQKEQVTGSPPTVNPTLMVFVSVYDNCQNAGVFFSQASTGVFTVKIADDLSSALVTASIPANDTITNQAFDMDVDVILKATGRIQTSRDTTRTVAGGTVIVDTTLGFQRPAKVTQATITRDDDPTASNFVSDPSGWYQAEIHNDTDTTITITKP